MSGRALGILARRTSSLSNLITMDDHQFRQILDFLNYSWTGYRKVRRGVKKRISRHMQQLGCPNIEAYLLLLRHNDEERKACERQMAVSISRFFRDRKLWLFLEKEIVPLLIEAQKAKLKVWSAGCARGEEVYSFLIVWDRLKATFKSLPDLEIIASDFNSEYIQKAKTGIYTASSLKEVPASIRDAYFEKKMGGTRLGIKPFVKKNISWQFGDIFSGPPGSGFHIIFLRNNLLTYYRSHLISSAFNKIVDSLSPGGWLIIGSHEKLPENSSGLIGHHSNPWAYRKEAAVEVQQLQ